MGCALDLHSLFRRIFITLLKDFCFSAYGFFDTECSFHCLVSIFVSLYHRFSLFGTLLNESVGISEFSGIVRNTTMATL